MFCVSCGKEAPEGAAFCEGCGAALTPGVDGAGNAAVAADKLNWKVVGPVLAVAIAAVAIVAFVAFQGNAADKKASGRLSATIETPAITVDGEQITALARPALVAFAAEGDGSSEPLVAAVPDLSVDSDLGNVLYADDVLHEPSMSEERQLFAENGFVVSGSGGDEFFEKYESNRYGKLPSFVTTDSMMHTYHLFFSHLLKNTERTYLADELADVSQEMLEASEEQLDELKGTEWESAAERNTAFFAVGASLLDSSTKVPDSVSSVVEDELSLVNGASQTAASPLLGHKVDYTQYIVRGYYEGDAVLEPYFRAMMWYGQASFLQESEDLGDDLDRSALLMTLALDEGAFGQWERVYEVTSFFAGASDDCGYYEYKPLFAAAYGPDADISDLAGNDDAWQAYHGMTAQMPAPRINSVIGDSDGDPDNSEDKCFRFMGQRFTIDAAIFQHLMADDVPGRMLPNALDVPAALGSDEAYSILKDEGETSYPSYDEKMAELRGEFADAPDEVWNASLYSRWLYALDPLLEQKGDGWPAFMQSAEWTRKNLQSYLGSYTELKHDTVLYSKQAMAEAGGMVERTDDRGYVEPEPELYGRLAALAQATSDGLSSFGMLASDDADSMARLQELATQLKTISEKELRNEGLTEDEYELIRSYGVQLEHFWEEAHAGDGGLQNITHWDFPAAVVTDVASGDGEVLELGIGQPSVIYVAVPVDGQLRIASGTVFSFYQFDWPASDRLTDTSWREMMGFVNTAYSSGQSGISGIKPEEWTQAFTAE